MPAAGMLIGTGLAGPLGSAARWAGAGILFATAIWGLVEALRGDDDVPHIWGGWRLLVSGAALSLDDLGEKLGAATGEHGEVVGAVVVLIGISVAMAMGWLLRGQAGIGLSGQEIAALTRSATFFSAAGVHSMSA
jgi:putative Mn2+ efflux pump MntP